MYLKLLGPGAMPVGQSYPLDKELSLRPALKGTWGWGIWIPVCLLGGWHCHGWLPPPPVQDLLHTAFQHRTLWGGHTHTEERKRQKEPIVRGGAQGSYERGKGEVWGRAEKQSWTFGPQRWRRCWG